MMMYDDQWAKRALSVAASVGLQLCGRCAHARLPCSGLAVCSFLVSELFLSWIFYNDRVIVESLALREDSGCNITEFLNTRKFLRMWERLRYGICEVVMQKMLEQRQGSLDALEWFYQHC